MCQTAARLGATLLAMAAVSWLSGCAGQPESGPRITERPEGFGYQPQAYAARKVLPDREVVRQSGYFPFGDSSDSILITEYRGTVTREQVESARDAAARKWTYQKYGPLQDRTIDGRQAFSWLIVQERDGEESGLAIIAVVPYEKRTYSIEFHATDPLYRKSLVLERTVESFVVRDRGRFSAVQLVGALGFVAIAGVLTRRLKGLERRERLTITA